jgi:hypothetical protein
MSILSYNNIKVNRVGIFSLAEEDKALLGSNLSASASSVGERVSAPSYVPLNVPLGLSPSLSESQSAKPTVLISSNVPLGSSFPSESECDKPNVLNSSNLAFLDDLPDGFLSNSVGFPVRLDNKKQVGIEEIKPIHTEDPKWFEKHNEFRIERQILADVLTKAGHLKEAESVRKCGERFIAYKAECCGDTLAYSLSCGHRLCPVCMVKRSVRLSSKVEKLIKKMENTKHIVLTAKNVLKIDKAYFKWLRECFVKLRHRDIFSKCVGGFYSIETTYNSKLKNWHVHIHIVIDVPYILKSDLSEVWKEITGNSYIVDIHEIKNPLEVAREVAKYVVKPGDFLQDSKLVHEYLKAVRGMRLVSTFGKYYNMSLDEDEEDGVPECYCGKCKVLENQRNHHLKYAWRQLKGFYLVIAVFKDSQGFYRLKTIISDG